jgi:hypothetical protein
MFMAWGTPGPEKRICIGRLIRPTLYTGGIVEREAFTANATAVLRERLYSFSAVPDAIVWFGTVGGKCSGWR